MFSKVVVSFSIPTGNVESSGCCTSSLGTAFGRARLSNFRYSDRSQCDFNSHFTWSSFNLGFHKHNKKAKLRIILPIQLP